MLSETKADEIGERAAEVLHADPFAGGRLSHQSFGSDRSDDEDDYCDEEMEEAAAPAVTQVAFAMKKKKGGGGSMMNMLSRRSGGGGGGGGGGGTSRGMPPPGAPQAKMRPAPPPPPSAPGALCRSLSPAPAAASVPAPASAAPDAAASAATPTPEPAQPEPQPTDGAEGGGGGGVDVSAVVAGARDYTKVPAQMDRRFEALDEDGALRPTIIKPAEPWSKTSQNGKLLEKPTTRSLGGDDLEAEKVAAFDLIDALTRSGALPFEHAALHVVIAATHCFDRSVVETVVRANCNPIEKVERSALILAETVHQQPVDALLSDDDPSLRERVEAASPQLFPRLGSS